MPTPPQLVVAIIAGCLGGGYWVYGKKNERYAFMVAGAVLCVYPYFVESAWALAAIGVLAAAAPFFVDF